MGHASVYQLEKFDFTIFMIVKNIARYIDDLNELEVLHNAVKANLLDLKILLLAFICFEYFGGYLGDLAIEQIHYRIFGFFSLLYYLCLWVLIGTVT